MCLLYMKFIEVKVNSDLLYFKGQYCARDKTSVFLDSKLAGTAKIGTECSFLAQKHGRKKKENVSFSQRIGGGVLFYDCERNLFVEPLW